MRIKITYLVMLIVSTLSEISTFLSLTFYEDDAETKARKAYAMNSSIPVSPPEKQEGQGTYKSKPEPEESEEPEPVEEPETEPEEPETDADPNEEPETEPEPEEGSPKEITGEFVKIGNKEIPQEDVEKVFKVIAKEVGEDYDTLPDNMKEKLFLSYYNIQQGSKSINAKSQEVSKEKRKIDREKAEIDIEKDKLDTKEQEVKKALKELEQKKAEYDKLLAKDPEDEITTSDRISVITDQKLAKRDITGIETEIEKLQKAEQDIKQKRGVVAVKIMAKELTDIHPELKPSKDFTEILQNYDNADEDDVVKARILENVILDFIKVWNKDSKLSINKFYDIERKTGRYGSYTPPAQSGKKDSKKVIGFSDLNKLELLKKALSSKTPPSPKGFTSGGSTVRLSEKEQKRVEQKKRAQEAYPD